MITINYLAHDRSTNFWNITKYFLNRIKEENKREIRVNILSTHTADFERLDGIETNIVLFNSGYNYMAKVEYALSQDTKYSVKLDEDCFIGNHVWDYMIENVKVLDSDDNFILAPLLSNNIPLVDRFIESFVTDESVKEQIYSDFLKRNMPNGLWGVDYSPLNDGFRFSRKALVPSATSSVSNNRPNNRFSSSMPASIDNSCPS